MRISIYQINPDRAGKGLIFEHYDALPECGNRPRVDASLYDRVFSGNAKAVSLEDIYRMFNTGKPDGFRGRFLSVSDVVEVTESEDIASGFYYCDTSGFRKIPFEKEKAAEPVIRVVMAEPGKAARVTEVGTSTEELQSAVGGFFETYYPFPDEDVCIVCNDEGKINGMEPCRAIQEEGGSVTDIIFGPFFICDAGGENFASLSEEQLRKYLKLFYCPENFFRIGERIYAEKYSPEGGDCH